MEATEGRDAENDERDDCLGSDAAGQGPRGSERTGGKKGCHAPKKKVKKVVTKLEDPSATSALRKDETGRRKPSGDGHGDLRPFMTLKC